MSDAERLEHVRRNDPDGYMLTPPTSQDYAAFVAWIVETYGERIMRRYFGESWDSTSAE